MKLNFFFSAVIFSYVVFVFDSVGCVPPPPPTIQLTANHDYVIVGNAVTLSAQVSTVALKYSWDFDGDGAYEYAEYNGNAPDSTFDGQIRHTFLTTGDHTVTVRAIYNAWGDAKTTTCVVHVGVDADNDNIPDDFETLHSGCDLNFYLHYGSTGQIKIYVGPTISDYRYDVPDLQIAIDASAAGDTIVIAKGSYNPNSAPNSTFSISKSIILTSTDPLNWETISQTILIDGYDTVTLLNAGTVTIKGLTITQSNYGSVHGGIISTNSSPVVSNCIFSGNQEDSGAAVYLNNTETNLTASFSSCLFLNNVAWDYGGAIYNNNADISLINCVISGNSASMGGGIYNSNSKITLSGCTFANNIVSNSSSGSALYNSTPSTGSTVKGCIFWHNYWTDYNYFYTYTKRYTDSVLSTTTTLPEFSYCEIEDSTGNWGNIGANIAGNIDCDPQFINGENVIGSDGIYGTYDDGLRLSCSSACVDAGFYSTETAFDIDAKAAFDISSVQNGGGGYRDMGAYELPRILFVDASATSGQNTGLSWGNAYIRLYTALSYAQDGDEIWVAKGTYNPITADDPFYLNRNIAVYGGFSGLCGRNETRVIDRDLAAWPVTLSGDFGANKSPQVLRISKTCVVDGFIITGGNAQDTVGGGIYSLNCSPVIRNCIITGNSATNGGGAIYFRGWSPTIENCVICNNSSSTYGGGVLNDCSSGNFINCTFANNTAVNNDGLSMRNLNSNPTITNCIMWHYLNQQTPDQYREISNYFDPDSIIPFIGSCYITNWDSSLGVVIANLLTSDPQFVNSSTPAGNDGQFFTFDDGLRMTASLDGTGLAPLIDILSLPRHSSPTLGAYETYLESNSDGIPDDWEAKYGITPGTDPYSAIVAGGLTIAQAYQFKTNPNLIDTDGDGMSDKWEIDNGLDPLTWNPNGYLDSDGQSNLQQSKLGLDPKQTDSCTTWTYIDYDDAGSPISQMQVEYRNGQFTILSQTLTEYDLAGHPILTRKIANPNIGPDITNDDITLTEYDDYGLVTKVVHKGPENQALFDQSLSPQEEVADIVNTMQYDSSGKVTQSVVYSPEGQSQTTSYSYDAVGQLTMTNLPGSRSTSREFDAFGRLYKSYDEKGNYTVYNYDSAGHVITKQQFDSHTTPNTAVTQERFAYNALGDLIRQVLMADASSSSNADVQVDKVIDYVYVYVPNSQTSTYKGVYTLTYNGVNAVTSQSVVYTSIDESARGLPAVITSGESSDQPHTSEVICYDKAGRAVQRILTNFNKTGSSGPVIDTQMLYDNLGRMTASIQLGSSLNLTTAYSYNGLGNQAQVTNPKGILTAYEYNGFGQVCRKTEDSAAGGMQRKTDSIYDRMGRLISLIAWENPVTGQTTNYGYDEFNRVTSITYPDNCQIAYTYNDLNKVTTRVDQRGITTAYTYDVQGNLITKEVASSSITETYEYDARGIITKAAKNEGGSTSEDCRTVNGLGYITQSTQVISGNTKSVSYTRDQLGQPTLVTYPGNVATLAFSYTSLGQVNQISRGSDTLAAYDYYGSYVNSRTYPLGSNPDVKLAVSYDEIGRYTSNKTLNSDGTGDGVNFEYANDLNGNITSQTYIHRSGAVNTFNYDQLDRITSANYGVDSSSELFTMDIMGNRVTAKNRSEATDTTYEHNTSNEYTQIAGPGVTTQVQYDSAGNMTQDEKGYTYAYDYENRITSISSGGNTKATYKYDALGRRIEAAITGGDTIRYYYDGDRVLVETDSAGLVQRYFVYGNYIDEVLMMRNITGTNSGDYYYGHDHLFSPCVLFASNGDVVERYEYDVYGKPKIMDASYAARTSSSYGNPYMFTGRNVDFLDSGSLKIQYSRNRYYSYTLGRWYSRDPLVSVPNAQSTISFSVVRQYTDGMSLYEYARSNPENYSDPLGLTFIDENGNYWKPPRPLDGCKNPKYKSYEFKMETDTVIPPWMGYIHQTGTGRKMGKPKILEAKCKCMFSCCDMDKIQYYYSFDEVLYLAASVGAGSDGMGDNSDLSDLYVSYKNSKARAEFEKTWTEALCQTKCKSLK